MAYIPRHPSEVTQDWLRQVLGDAHLKLASVDTLGEGYMSRLLRLHIGSDSETTPDTMIVKIASSDDANLAIAMAFDSYRKETRFYRHIAQAVKVNLPHVYLNEVSPDGGRFLLGLEDLSHLAQVAQGDSADKSQTMQAMRTLAAIHASHWQQQEHTLPAFPDAVEASAEGLPTMLEASLAVADSSVGAGVRQLLLTYAGETAVHLPSFLEAPQTLIHSDFRSSNIFFNTTHDLATVVDWGDFVFGPAAFDLAIFLTSSLSVDNRRHWERGALELYTASLAEAGIDYPFASCWDDYRLLMPPCAYLPAMVAGGIEAADTGLATELFHRLDAAISDNLDWLQERFGITG